MPELLPRKNWTTFRRSEGAFACCSKVVMVIHPVGSVRGFWIFRPVFSNGDYIWALTWGVNGGKDNVDVLCAGARNNGTATPIRD